METGRDRYTLAEHAAAHQNLIAGRLTMHRDGYGFVIPNAGQRSTISGDIYINPQSIGSAMHGDQVLVELGRKKEDGRAEGRILRVLSRGNPTVVGIFHHGCAAQLRDADGRENHPGGHHSARDGMAQRRARGRAFAASTWERNKRLASASRSAIASSAEKPAAANGTTLKAWSWTSRSPTGLRPPRARAAEWSRSSAMRTISAWMSRSSFASITCRTASRLRCCRKRSSSSRCIPSGELRHRRDYRSLPIVTIDGETARDFDDAVTVRRMSNGNFELQVHIADVAHYVRESSAIDLEARLRGTSVYFPDRAVPMLPMELSTDMCSLRPQVDRLVLSCVMEIDHAGEILGYTLNEGVIHSAERMTYTNVNLILEGDHAQRQRYHQLVDVFELMRELAMVLNRKRVRRGSIDFDLPEPVIEFDENGLMKGITRSERNIANRIIEEFMLSANECVASYLENKRIASLYRIHEKPDPKRVYDFETIAARFGYSLGVGPLPIKRVQMRAERRDRYGTGRRPQTIEVPEEVHITPRMYQKLTQKIAGKPEERILSYLMLRSLKQARYSEKNEGHFALAAPTYTHFTSPIRRYPDLIVHRILKDVLRDSAEREEHGVPIGVGGVAHSESPSPWSKRQPPASPAKRGGHESERRGPLGGPIPEDMLHDIAEESSQSERRADDAERELMEWKKTKFMEERIGEEFDGLIVSVTKFGMFVELIDMFIEGLVPLGSLTDDHYLYHENTRQIIGQRSRKTYSLGDPIRVLVDRIDRTQRRINFAVVEERPARGKRRSKK